MAVLMWIQAHIAAPWLDTLMVIITKSGDVAAVWFILAALLCVKREHRGLGLRMILALLLSVLLAIGFALIPQKVVRAAAAVGRGVSYLSIIGIVLGAFMHLTGRNQIFLLFVGILYSA